VAGRPLAEWTLTLKTEGLLVAAGALMSFRTGWSLLGSSLLTYLVLAPSLVERGLIEGAGYKAIVNPSKGTLVKPYLSRCQRTKLYSIKF
jgi:hypothetical protein